MCSISSSSENWANSLCSALRSSTISLEDSSFSSSEAEFSFLKVRINSESTINRFVDWESMFISGDELQCIRKPTRFGMLFHRTMKPRSVSAATRTTSAVNLTSRISNW